MGCGGSKAAEECAVEKSSATMKLDGDQEALLDKKPSKSEEDMRSLTSISGMIKKMSRQNKKISSKLYLALAIASWMTIFGLPAYSEHAQHAIFGVPYRLVDGKRVEMCSPTAMGFKINNGTDEKPQLIRYTHQDLADGENPDVWCGFFPYLFLGAWPGVVQTAMFTLYVSSGTTVKLAWQCIIGTGCSVLNILMLSCLYPEGIDSPNYNDIVAWADLVVVIFLFLASRAALNTKMMGCCWTTVLMMHFMTPGTGSTLGKDPTPIPGINYDAETTMVMVTSTLGVIIAVLATIVPKPLSNIRHVHEDATEIVKGFDHVLTEALNYYCKGEADSKRFIICAKISSLERTVRNVQGNLDDSFWETFNLFHFGMLRKLYETFNMKMLQLQDVFHLIEISILRLKFDTVHQCCVQEMQGPMFALKDKTIETLDLCLKCCMDADISDEERQTIEECVSSIEERLRELCQGYQRAMASQHISEEIAPDTLFAFSLADWCRGLQDWAADLSQFKANEGAKTVESPLTIAKTQFVHIFDPRFMFCDKENIRTTIMNALPILITFAIAYFTKGSVFVKYATTMPATLALLVTYEYGSSFFKNLQRLMGVTFGKTLPLLLISVVGLMPCSSNLRLVFHACAIFIFYFVFTFVYYASDRWSTVGCLIAGFGCYTLFVPCSEDDTLHYGALFKDIAEVIVAIMIKMLISSSLSPKEPRDLAIESLEASFDEAFSGLKSLFEKGPQQDDGAFDEKIKKAKGALSKCRDLALQCDPLLQIAPGWRTPFKIKLYTGALQQMRLVLADMDMLTLSLKGHEVEHVVRTQLTKQVTEDEEKARVAAEQKKSIWASISSLTSWHTIKEDVLSTVERSFRMCLILLKHATDEDLNSEDEKQLTGMKNLDILDGTEEFYKDVSYAVEEVRWWGRSSSEGFPEGHTITQLRLSRFVVCINSLALITEHSAQMAQLCFKYMVDPDV